MADRCDFCGKESTVSNKVDRAKVKYQEQVRMTVLVCNRCGLILTGILNALRVDVTNG